MRITRQQPSTVDNKEVGKMGFQGRRRRRCCLLLLRWWWRYERDHEFAEIMKSENRAGKKTPRLTRRNGNATNVIECSRVKKGCRARTEQQMKKGLSVDFPGFPLALVAPFQINKFCALKRKVKQGKTVSRPDFG